MIERYVDILKALAAVRKIPAHEFTEEIRLYKLRLSMRDQNRCVVGPGSEVWQAILENNPLQQLNLVQFNPVQPFPVPYSSRADLP